MTDSSFEDDSDNNMKPVIAIILNTDLTYNELLLNNIEDYQKVVGGNIQRVVSIRPTFDIEGKEMQNNPLCYCNEEGVILQLTYNKWCKFLQSIGIGYYGEEPFPTHGTLILVGDDQSSYDVDVDPYIKSLMDEYLKCNDLEKDQFLKNLNEKQIEFDKINRPLREKRRKEQSDQCKQQ